MDKRINGWLRHKEHAERAVGKRSSMRGKTGQQLDSGKWVVAFLKKFPIPMMAKAKNLKVSGNV